MIETVRTARRSAHRAGLVIALTAALALLCCGGGISAYFLGGLGGDNPVPLGGVFNCGRGGPVDPNGALPRLGALGEEQIRNAAIIINVGAKMQVPPRGWVIAVATALQESYLRNLGNLGSRNDHDSLGLFQQRPSQGWGTPEQIMNPEYASRKFYEKLLQVDGWMTLPLTVAAQRVQRSAYPDAYAKHEPFAAQIVNLLADGAARAVGSLANLQCVAPGEIAASGWTVPVKGSIVSGFRTPDRPSHNGVDIAATRFTLIRSAAAGIVVVARCNVSAPDGGPWSCDRDGSPAHNGCGWYVDILHAGNFITRYCHMVSQPRVQPGDRVVAGQVIGQVGSSGSSSGPHLHFETHLDGDRSSAGAVDPQAFMRDRGAPLGAQA
ncbi:MAG TPA: M23 family metallopeptidase [Micromonosporaceae bacterium]|nr:M23 family metallopeptidase [Micromonosporaceae bacterium]